METIALGALLSQSQLCMTNGGKSAAVLCRHFAFKDCVTFGMKRQATL